MLDLHAMAIEAVKCRRERSPYFGEFLKELEATGCSPSEIRAMLARAEAELPEPQPTALQDDLRDPRLPIPEVEWPRVRHGFAGVG